MMKQTRIIRISFLICTICMVAAFWSGFYFGESQLKADTAPVQTASCPDTDSKKSSTEEKKNISGTDSVESMNHLSEEKYYVKVSGEYLSVYFSDTDRLFFIQIQRKPLPPALGFRQWCTKAPVYFFSPFF